MLNWAIGIDMYTLMCIKLMPNKNLQYKKKQTKQLILRVLIVVNEAFDKKVIWSGNLSRLAMYLFGDEI